MHSLPPPAASGPAASPEEALLRMFAAAVDSAHPAACVPRYLPAAPTGRTVVVGAGKAAAAMALAVEKNWTGPLSGVVVTRYGHGLPCRRIEVIEASHPLPDQAGVDATRRMLAQLDGLTEHDLVLCLISGGGSALLTAPPPGVSLADERDLVGALLGCGATIAEMNCVRKHLSLVKGGRLALAASPARLVTLAISDVPGDDASVIASGPTVADPTTRSDARAVLQKYDLSPAPAVWSWLEDAASETPKPGQVPAGEYHMVASPQLALEAAAETAEEMGYTPVILGSAIEGEAREVALVHAGITRQTVDHQQPCRPPCVILSGGETTVTVRGRGRGGRNAEFLLALAIALDGRPDVHALAADTDGIDGTEDNAGAIIGPDTLARGLAAGASAVGHLHQNDGYSFFAKTGSLVVTGPSMTNVNDFRAILVTEAAAKESVGEARRP